MESWMVSIATGLLAVAFGYGIVRNRLDALEKGYKSHLEADGIYHHDSDKKLDAQFKRIDELSGKYVFLETTITGYLDMQTAEDKFVSKDELTLHLKSIDKELAHMTKNSDMMVGKLNDLTSALSTYMLRGLNEKETK